MLSKLVLAVNLLTAIALVLADEDADSVRRYGWKVSRGSSGGDCNVKKVDIKDLSLERFKDEFETSVPVIVTGLGDARNVKFREASARDVMLERYGRREITLSTANTQSYKKRRVLLEEYIRDFVEKEQNNVEASGSDTWYWFGNNDHQEWADFFDAYVLPPFAEESKAALSFGIGAQNSGVPFHIHGRVFAETIVGRKRWLLLPPGMMPKFDGDKSTANWLTTNLHHDVKQAELLQNVLDCTVSQSEVIYIPADWWHATLNLDQTVFISTFIDDSVASKLNLFK
mmetsp:Transcript_19081/g.76549  ORF Transcript_19081/g.76549 Transcript_19081/m.76549 type:complete len:285 (-) Transcript_19081:24-878(-)|eukprot:CAMPEP_0113968214 /NCGR_PEP_ID=MMETSP0011_2-20120614/9391_1 /TAXON_ID=101924 /ORGANISM="Rhodosorus marinus" /LENGTH=284 /DNA_ID=CAMNT_0000981243 /DNA_START=193 /DNA_END=1047 /DNA_ORIENTATION=+ /assembly_acc=CAM_ASM_000156